MKLPVAIPFNDRAKPENALKFTSVEQVVEFLKSKYSGGMAFGIDELTSNGAYRYMAFYYDFSAFLKKFLVLEYGHYWAYFAPNRTALRRARYLKRNARIWDFPTH